MHKSEIRALLLPLAVLIGVVAGPLRAQPSNGYLFFAPGGVTCCGHTAMTLHFGAGGEKVLAKGIGVGAEIGALGPRQYFSDSVIGVFSPNGYYHFGRGRDIRIDPFVTGGYTLYFRSGHASLGNVGGGLNYWFHSRLGARFEFRDHIQSSGPVHTWGFRFALAFR